jgi:lysozyme
MTQRPTAIGSAGIELIKRFEGLRLVAYLCPAGKLTIGYGHVIAAPKFDCAILGVSADVLREIVTDSQKFGRIKPEHHALLHITEAQAEMLLRSDLRQTALFLASVTRAALNQNQFDALASFIFNVGQGNYAQSTLRKKLDAGDFAGAADEFPKWKYGTMDGKKVVLNGLVRRRAAERELFLREPL